MFSSKVVNSIYKSSLTKLYHVRNAYYNSSSMRPLFRQNQRNFLLPHSLTTPMPVDDQETKDVLNYLNNEIYPEIMGEIKKMPEYQEIPPVFDRLESLISYLALNGKRFQSIRMMKDSKIFADPQDLTLENRKLCAVACWVVEFIQTVYLVIDDILDDGKIRRGKTPWFRLPEIGLDAINDAAILEMFAYDILRKYFSNQSNYTTVLHMLQKTVFVINLGQGFGVHCYIDPDKKKNNFDMFNMDNYRTCCKFINMHQGVLMPLELSMVLVNKYDAGKISQVYHILLEMGTFIQIQNEFRDFFKHQGDVLEKNAKPTFVGTDIELGKLTWFAVQTLAKGNEEQKKLFKENYGRKDKSCVEAIFNIYEQLHLDMAYLDYEDSSYKWVCKEIRKINNAQLQEVLENYVESFYRRRP